MTIQDAGALLGAVGVAMTAAGFFMAPPSGGGLTYWNPLPCRARLAYASSGAGIILALAGAVIAAYAGETSDGIHAAVAGLGVAVVAVGLSYALSTQRLYQDRRRALRDHGWSEPIRERAKATASLRWCLRHPFADGMWPDP